MKKRAFVIFVSFFTLFFIFSVSVSAADSEKNIYEEIIEEFENAIPEESGVKIDTNDMMDSFSFKEMLYAALGGLGDRKGEIISFLMTVIGFCILGVMCDSVSLLGAGNDRTVSAAFFTVMSIALYPRIYSVFLSVSNTLDSISVFFGAALPAMTAITAATGAVKSAGVQAMNMNIALGIVGNIASHVLMPLCLSLLALALVSSFGDGIAVSVSNGIKSLFTFGLGIVTAVSSAAIALQSVIASASDSAALRAARYAVGGLIPVVGSSVSGALSTLAGGLAYAKSTVGALSIATISIIAIAPLLHLILYRMIFSLAISFMEYMDNARGKRCFFAYRTAFDAVISVYVMSTLVCIIQVLVFIKGGVSQI